MTTALVAAVLLFAPGASRDSDRRVVLLVSDRLGVARSGEAVCSGIPFAKGVLPAGRAMHVETETGKPLPTQTKELGHWPDGTVKWLLVQFPADCPADSGRSYALAPGDAPPPVSPIHVEQTPEVVTVDTGVLRAGIPKKDLTILGDVWIDGNPKAVLSGGMPMTFLLENGAVHTSAGAAPDLVELEETGPVRVTVRVTGWLKGPGGKQAYRLDTRLRFYAGQSYIRADCTFVCLGKPDLHRVKAVSLDLKQNLVQPVSVSLAGAAEPMTLETGQTAILTVDRQLVCRAGIEKDLKTVDRTTDGWALVSNAAVAIGVAIEGFRHLNPKAIEVTPAGIRLALWSDRAGETLNLGRTRAKTHQVLLDFRPTGSDRAAQTLRLRAFAEPLIATTTPEYFCSTDALGTLSPAGKPETTAYDGKIRRQFETLLAARRTQPLENGMLHYGDYYHGGYGNKATRGDLEYDTGHGCFLLYARSGDRDYYNVALACNRHFIDMDINQENGHQRYHGYSENAETHEAVTTGLEWGHVFVDCPADAYYLTGDERSLDAVRKIADAVSTIAEGNGHERIRTILAGAERQLGWPLLVLCRAYEVLGDDKYRKAADKVVEYIKVYARNPVAAYQEGTWWRSWMMDGCKPFMTGELHNGLSAYYAITGDKELRQAIVTSLNWLIDHMWNPEGSGFVYEFNAFNRPHRLACESGLNMLVVDAFRFGYEMTGDERYLSVAVRAFARRTEQMQDQVDGKQFSQDARSSPHTAAYFHRKGITTASLPPSPLPVRQNATPLATQPRPDVLLRASFDGDLKCQTPDGEKTGQSVKTITFVNGRHGQAVAVGMGGYAWLPAPRELLMGPGSIELWVQLHFKKQPTSPEQRAVFHIEGETPLIDSLGLMTCYTDLRVRMKDHVGHLNGTAEGNITQWEPRQWHHVVVTWDADRVRLYLDGHEQTRADEGTRPGDGVADLPLGPQTRISLGWRFGNWFCDCTIDDLTLYGRVLTPAEVTAQSSQK